MPRDIGDRSHGFAWRGKAELLFASYGLHDDESSVLRQAVQASMTRESLQMGAGEDTDALDNLVHRIEHLVQPQTVPPDDQSSFDTNPFSVQFSLLKELFNWLSGAQARQPQKGDFNLRPDTSLDAVARALAILQAAGHVHEVHQVLKSGDGQVR